MHLFEFLLSGSLRTVLISTGLLMASGSFAQDTTNATIDSLIMQLMNDEEDTNKVNVYNQLSDEYLMLDYQKSFEYSRLAYDLAEELEFKNGLLQANLALGHLEMAYNLNYDKALEIYNRALPLAQELGDKRAEMVTYKWISYVYGAQKMYDLAKDYNQKARDIATSLNSDKDLSDLHAYMGGLCEESNDTASAIDHYKEVLEIEKKNDFRETSNAAMIVIGRYYYLIDDIDQALKYYRIALKSFERMLDHRWTSYTHAEMARLLLEQKDLKRAVKHGLKGAEIAELHNFKKEMGDNYLVLSDIYTAMDSTELASRYKSLHDSILSLLNPIDEVPNAIMPVDEPQKERPEKMNGFVQAIFILIPFILFVFVSGLSGRKKA